MNNKQLIISLISGLFIIIGCKELKKEMFVSTGEVSKISFYSAEVSGAVIDVGEGATQRGHCYGTTPDVTINNLKTISGAPSGKGDYISQLMDLEAGTKYYIRAYLSDGTETVYGKEKSFFTFDNTVPEITTKGVNSVTISTAISGGDIVSDGGLPITARGVCWNTTGNPTTSNNITIDGEGPGSFVSNLEGLTPLTVYYVRAYATNSSGTAYGDQVPFETSSALATLNTEVVTSITAFTAISGGDIVSDGGLPITARGVCWNTTGNPTTSNNKTIDGEGPGSFVSNLAGLDPKTVYFVRSYATNSSGTAYGNEVNFETSPIPAILTTNEVTSITGSTAISGGNITSDGGSAVIARGVCWNVSGNPTTSDDISMDGEGPGSFVSNITELASNTVYYVRAYAITDVSTAYGNEVSFRSDFICGTRLSDQRDDITYLTVQIGGQCWFAENLNVGIMIDGSLDQTDNAVIEKYCYSNDEGKCLTFGGLYQWDEMMQYTLDESTMGICPVGWHVPSDYDWKILEMTLGMSQAETDSAGWRGIYEGGMLKALGYWDPPNEGASNSSLFTALPAGNRVSDGTFDGLQFMTDFWTSTFIIDTQSWYRYLDTEHSQIYRVDGFRQYGTSVRCVRD